MPMIVEMLRRGLRPNPRRTISQRTGRRLDDGTIVSRRLRVPRLTGTTPRIASAGSTRTAARAGTHAATSPEPMPKAMPMSGVNG